MEHEKIYYINQNSTLKPVIRLYMCGITLPDKNYAIARKKSRYAVIEYVEKGRGAVNIDGKIFYPEEGDSYLLGPGSTHDYHSDEKAPWQKVFINFGGPLAEKLIEAYNLEGHSYFPGLNLKKELYEIIELAKKPAEDCTAEISAIINGILTRMYLSVNSEVSVSEAAREMKKLLNMKITSDFSIKELCELISRSESQTINIFKKACGITPYAYLLNKKISFAKTMLVNSSLSVKEVAYTLRFADEYYFSNLFKSKVGMSPGEYRKSNGK